VKLADPIRKLNFSATLLAFSAVMPLCVAQKAGPTASATTPPKPITFAVVSIRPSQPGSRIMIWPTTTPDGYRATGQSMLTTIMFAYFPQDAAFWWSKNRLSGAPAWLSQQYDINAKVSDADLAEWQKQGSTLDKKLMFLAMLQTMLAERCHLIAHMAPGPTQPGWSLELGKHALHLTESKPGAELPAGIKLPDGGVMASVQPGDKPRMAIYGGTMADFAFALSMFASQPVQDHTGLTGHYDFAVDWIGYPDEQLSMPHTKRNDPDPLSRWNIEALGLRSTSISIPDNTLVIDHIEKPSEN
jgi:uncharacterized protein (TIGR03435 family)